MFREFFKIAAGERETVDDDLSKETLK